ncbi:NAD-dependent epimerase/dehydratase family protein, partial [uncultured Desulfovibrio sp.]
MTVLICGGAGYIGSHAVRALRAQGREVVVLDNLLTGHRQSLPADVPFVEGDMRDPALLDAVFGRYAVDGVLHFAASSLVGESMQLPLAYFSNNVHGMQTLLEAMVRHGVARIVFSSSAAVYGEPDSVPITEDAPLRPGNPYGESKRIMESMMRWAAVAHGLRYVSLRYFNVGGAVADGSI